MKKLLFLILVLGAMFAAGSFPNTISGTDLQMVSTEGTVGDGYALYATTDQKILAQAVTEPFTDSQWEQLKTGYTEIGWSTTTEGSLEYYYICDSAYNYDYDADEQLCLVDTYKDEVHYMIDVSVLGGSPSDALDIAKKIGNQLTGGGGIQSLCSCPVALLLIGITGAAVMRFA